MPHVRLAALSPLMAALFLSACASYAPSPLPVGVEEGQASRLRARPAQAPVSIDLSQPLTPKMLGLMAVASNPELKAARAKAGVARAQAFAAGLLPDPVLTLGADHILSGPDRVDPRLASLAFDLMSLADHGAAKAGGAATARQARLDMAWQEWQTAGQARLLAARIAALERILALDSEGRARAEAMLSRVLPLAARGDVKADEVETRRLAAADAVDKARQAERDLDAARQDLNKLLGLAPDVVLRITADPPPPPPGEAQALFERAVAERLDLQALRAGYASQEAATRKAVLDQFPNLQLTVTRQRDTTGNQLIGPSVNFTLPLWNRNQGGVAVARATREQLRAEYEARLFATRAEIADLVANLTVARRQRDEIAAQLAPLEPLVAAGEAAARRGDIAQAAADAARQSLVDKRLSLAVLNQTLAEQTVALDIAVGGPAQEVTP